MKKINILITAICLSASAAFAQCSQVANNFEVKLLHMSNHTLKVQVRHHANEVAGAKSMTPTKGLQLDGMVFAIAWPTQAKVSLGECKSLNKTFQLVADKQASKGQNKAIADNMQTFFHDNTATMPVAFESNWADDKWYDVASISYNGDLGKDEFFSLVNCDYGIAHPNSYAGNSSTDPWLSLFSGTEFTEVSPKMITELPESAGVNTCKVYPVPTAAEINVDIESAINTQVVAKVVDNSGRILKIVNFEVSKGRNVNVINIGDIAAGSYYLVVTDGKALNFSNKIAKN